MFSKVVEQMLAVTCKPLAGLPTVRGDARPTEIREERVSDAVGGRGKTGAAPVDPVPLHMRT